MTLQEYKTWLDKKITKKSAAIRFMKRHSFNDSEIQPVELSLIELREDREKLNGVISGEESE